MKIENQNIYGGNQQFENKKITKLKDFLKSKKTEAELPNDHTPSFNLGYVQAMNDVLNYLKT